MLRRELADVELAEAHVRQLREIVPEEKWISKFHDTVAWAEYVRATVLGPEPGRKLLLSAKERIQKRSK